MARLASIATFTIVAVLTAGAGTGCRRPPGPVQAALQPPAPDASKADLWAPWRQPARLHEAPYTTTPAATRVAAGDQQAADGVARFAEKHDRPIAIDLGSPDWSDTAGVEIRLRFRLARTPPGRLEASHSLAHFSLGGGKLRQGFYLHAYSRNSGFMLNGLAYGRRPPWAETRLLRGAAIPHAAVPFDTRWHTIALAWCPGQLAAAWNGLPILHVVDPAIDFSTLAIDWIDPGHAFDAIELAPLEIRPAHFAPP